MRRAQLFSQDIIFAIVLVLFTFSVWLILFDRVFTTISTNEFRRNIDESTASAMSQLLESSGVPTNWNNLSTINETTVGSIGLVSSRNVLDPAKVSTFVSLAGSGGSNYTTMKRLLGLDREGYAFNLTITSLNGTVLYNVSNTPSVGPYNASYAAVNTTASIDRFALLNNSLVKVTMGVWIG